MNIIEILSNNGFKNVVTVPDSLNKRWLSKDFFQSSDIRYIQVLNEISAVAISSGLNLVGEYTLCVIENSGIRYACDIITRFEMGHGIHNMYIISNRGEFGERNWWGIFHTEITTDILKQCRMKVFNVDSYNTLNVGLKKAMESFRSEQVSTVLIINYSFIEGIL